MQVQKLYEGTLQFTVEKHAVLNQKFHGTDNKEFFLVITNAWISLPFKITVP